MKFIEFVEDEYCRTNNIPEGRGIMSELGIAIANSFCGQCDAELSFQNSDIPSTCLLCGSNSQYVWAHMEMLEKANELLQKDICPQCERSINEKKQIGRCVYAYPCGHRLYQGRL